MSIEIEAQLLERIYNHGESAYPNEGAGLLLGEVLEDRWRITEILPLNNSREEAARHNRYLITADDMMHGEEYAERKGLDVLGVFHSHPDHPDQPSEFDRQWALPWYCYLITSVQAGKAVSSRLWRLAEDRSRFTEVQGVIQDKQTGEV